MAVTHAPKPKPSPKAAKQPESKRKSAPPPRPAPARTPVFLGGSARSGGQPLAPSVQAPIESSLQVNLDSVRVHTDAGAQQAAANVSARAFTYGRDIFLGRGERPTDLGLMAHEAAHVVQQQGAPSVQKWSAGSGDSFEHEAHQASAAVTSGQTFTVRERTSKSKVQRLGISDALDYFADKAYNIPGYRMFTILLGVNPINMSRVERSAANILRAIVEFLPGGHLITEALDKYGVFDKVGTWIEQQLSSLGITGSAIKQAVMDFLDSLSWRDIFHLGRVWDRAKRIFTDPIDRIITFAKNLFNKILQFIKDAILRPLAELASKTPAWDLICAIIGKNPITGDPVPRTAETLIGGFMKLIGQEEIWQNIKKANAIARAWAWFQNALSGLVALLKQLPSMFLDALRSLELSDIILLPRAFVKVGKVFLGFAGKFISWAGNTIWNLLEIIFSVLAPSVMPYLKKAAGAFRTILKNPIGFVGNLVKAGIQGFKQFASNFLTHLKKSLIDWLTGTLSGAGVYIPQGFTVMEIIKFVLSVLGLTWQNIRAKLVAKIGETAVKAMETGFDIVKTLVTEGPAAAWEKIVEAITNLKDMVMDGIMSFVKDRIVQAAITKLLTSLNPAGAFIQAIIAIYNTVMFFIERLKQIAQVAAAFIDSIAAIANGVIAAAANKVENTMGGLLTLVISFLARLVGLGKVSDAIKNILDRVRSPIDKALDKVIDWIINMARKLGRFIAQAGVPNDPNERLRLASQAAVSGARAFSGRAVTQPLLTPLLAGIKVRYGLNSIEPYQQKGNWWVRASINPSITQDLGIPNLVGPDGRTPLREYEQKPNTARDAEGANFQPIIGKLTQCVQMFTVWARLGTSPVAQQMLRQIETAREQAQDIYEAQRKGAMATQLNPRKQALAAQLRAIQALDPGYELISIGEMSIAITSVKHQMPVVPVNPWNMLDPALRPEYERQLRDQQDGINSMTAAQWERNRDAYVNRRIAVGSGRSRAGSNMQRTFQRRMGNPANTAAPHNPDQAPAGFADPTGLPADFDVNSHIGSQWPSRLSVITNAINSITPAGRLVTQMNVQLRVV